MKTIKTTLVNVSRLSLLSIFWIFGRSLAWFIEHIRFNSGLGGGLREVAVSVWTTSWLTFVWVLLWGTFSWANIIGGFVVAMIIITMLPLPRVPVEGLLHPATIAVLVVRLVRDFSISSLQVAWVSLRLSRPPMGAVVCRRVAIKSDMVLALAINYINLVPGTIVVEIDRRRRLLYIHVFDLSSPRKVYQFDSQMNFIERNFIHAFERDNEWRPSPYRGIDEEHQNRIMAQHYATVRKPL